MLKFIIQTIIYLELILIMVASQPIEVLPNESSVNEIVKTNGICLSKTCVKASSYFLNRIDQSINPCDDFYQFACGKFLKETIIPDDMTAENIINTVNMKIRKQILSLLVEEPKESEMNAVKLAKTFYKSCMKIDTIEQRGKKPLLDLIESYGGWPVVKGDKWKEEQWNWYDVHKKVFEDGLNQWLLYEVDIMPSFVNSTANRIFLKNPKKLGIERDLLLLGIEHKFVKKYFDVMVNFAIELGAGNRTLVEEELMQTLNFEILLAKLGDGQTNRTEDDQINLSDSLNDTLTLKDLMTLYPYFQWKDFLNTFAPNGVEIGEDEIIVSFTSIFEELNHLMEITPKRVVANYFMWRIIKHSSDFITEELRDLKSEYGMFVTGVQTKLPRWRLCCKNTLKFFKPTIDSLWLRKFFKEENKNAAKNIVEDIKNEFVDRLQNATWIDQKTKQYAITKAEKIHDFVGYPNWLLNDTVIENMYKNIELNESTFFENVLTMRKFILNNVWLGLRRPENTSEWAHYDRIDGVTSVNAYYSLRHNTIQIPAAFLEEEIFSKNHPNYLKFGVLGWSVAHEITHGYDDSGSRLDENGNLFNWWDDDTRSKFYEKAFCFSVQYGNYSGRSSDDATDKTRDEDIADNGGVKVAYSVYEKWIQENGEEQKLPGLDYTPKQLFWIANANFWCKASRPEMDEFEYLTNEHTADKFRIIGSASNMKEFSRDFNCPAHSKMNPEEKCAVW